MCSGGRMVCQGGVGVCPAEKVEKEEGHFRRGQHASATYPSPDSQQPHTLVIIVPASQLRKWWFRAAGWFFHIHVSRTRFFLEPGYCPLTSTHVQAPQLSFGTGPRHAAWCCGFFPERKTGRQAAESHE